MSHRRSLIKLLRKTGLIFLLTLIMIMLIHILITLFLYFTLWNAKYSSAFDAVLAVSLYYVIPLIVILCFYLIMNKLTRLEALYLEKKTQHKHKSPLLLHHKKPKKNKAGKPYSAKLHSQKHSYK